MGVWDGWSVNSCATQTVPLLYCRYVHSIDSKVCEGPGSSSMKLTLCTAPSPSPYLCSVSFPISVLCFAVPTIFLSFVLPSLLFPLSSVLVSLCSLYHLSWCLTVPSIICPGVSLFPLPSVLVSLCSLYHLSWCLSVPSITCPSVSLFPLSYVLVSLCSLYHLSWRLLCALYHLS